MSSSLAGALLFALLLSSGAPRAQPADPHEHVRVLVAARDLAYGEIARAEDLVEREVELQWVTSSEVAVDSREYVENLPVQVPVKQGDLLRWTMFESVLKPDLALREACMRATRAATTADGQLDQVRQNILRR